MKSSLLSALGLTFAVGIVSGCRHHRLLYFLKLAGFGEGYIDYECDSRSGTRVRPQLFQFRRRCALRIDNNKNNIAGSIICQIRLKTEIMQPGNVFPLAHVALPPITALLEAGSKGLLVRQSYTVTEVRFGQQPKDLGNGPMYSAVERRRPDHAELRIAGCKGYLPFEERRAGICRSADETFYIDLVESSTRSTSMCL
jgi:hypothetical protein